MTKFLLIRHGQPDYSFLEEKNFKGHGNDLAFLSKKGIEQAQEVAQDERLLGSEILVSSPYTRTMHTASIIANKLNLSINGEIDIHEWLPDLTYDYKDKIILLKNYLAAQKEFLSNYDSSNNNRQYESLMDVKVRSLNVLKKYLSYNKVIVVTHGGVMYSLTSQKYKYCDLLELEFDENQIKKMLIK